MDTTVLFNIVPENVVKNADDEWVLDADMIQIYSASSLTDKKEYKGFAYNYDEDANTFGAAILTTDMGFSGNINALAVVVSISDGLDANKEPASLVKFFQGGEFKTLVVATTAYAGDDITAAGAGDVFQYSVNGAGEINKAYVIFDYVKDGQSDLLMSEAGEVKYYVGVVTGNTAKVLTLGAESLAWDLEAGCTNVLFDTNLKVNKAVKGYSTTSYIKANIRDDKFTSDAYIAVVRVEDDVIADVVTFAFDRPEGTVGDFAAANLKLQ